GAEPRRRHLPRGERGSPRATVMRVAGLTGRRATPAARRRRPGLALASRAAAGRSVPPAVSNSVDFLPDNAPRTQREIDLPGGLALDKDGSVYFSCRRCTTPTPSSFSTTGGWSRRAHTSSCSSGTACSPSWSAPQGTDKCPAKGPAPRLHHCNGETPSLKGACLAQIAEIHEQIRIRNRRPPAAMPTKVWIASCTRRPVWAS